MSTINNDGYELNELKKENIELKARLQVLEAENKQFVEERKIHEDKWSKSEKNIASLEEKYQNEIAELKGKLTTQNEVFEEKLKKLEEVIHANQQKISEAEDEIMMAIHQMKVQLPLENWHDLLAFVPRSQLGNVVSEIGDYQFTRIIQSFLHDDVKKITLGEMKIIAPRPDVSTDQPMVKVGRNVATNIPDSSMPGNIKHFKEIELGYLDESVLNFLGKFQENSILTDVNMDFCCILRVDLDERYPLQVLTKIAPFITSIDSISIDSMGINLFAMVYNNNTNHGISHESQLLLKEMMAKTRVIWAIWHREVILPDKMNWFCSWLYTPRNDRKPRMLRLFSDSTDFASFIERIKKDFKIAKADHAVSFFIYADIYRNDNVEDISFNNLNERLVIKKVNRGDVWEELMISRYTLNAAKSWIEANEKEIAEFNGMELDRKIILQNGLTIGI